MPLTQKLSEQAEREKLEDDLTLPPGGHRSGEGTASILPHLSRILGARPALMHETNGPRQDEDGSPASG